MARAKYEAWDRAEWNRAAHVLAMIHNVNCVKKADLKEPGDYNPYTRKSGRKGIKITAANIGLLKVFASKNRRRK